MRAVKVTGAGFLILLASAPVSAVEGWDLRPAISVTTSYTDNLNLTATNEEESLILAVSPRLSLKRQGARGSLSFDYRPSLLIHSSSQGDDRVDHRFSGSLSSELIKRRFFIDSSATFTQQLIDRRSASGGDSVNAPDNFSDTATFQITPRWEQRVGSYTRVGARFTYDAVLFDEVDDDSSGTAYNIFVDTENSPSKLFWELSAGQSSSSPDESDKIREDRINARLNYRYSAQLIPSLNVGYVDNHLDDPTDDRASSGAFWGAGLRWRPNPRNSLDLNYNSRLQTNDSYGLIYQHRRRHSNWSLSYQESISSTRQELLSLVQIGALVCPQGSFTLDQCTFVTDTSNLALGPGEQAFGVTVTVPSLTNERFIQRTASGNVTASKGRSRVSLGLFRSEREFQLRDFTETDVGLNLSWAWTPARRTTFTTSWSWTRLEDDATENSYTSNLNLAMNRALTPETSLNGSLRSLSRHSADDSREFDEFTVVVGINKIF